MFHANLSTFTKKIMFLFLLLLALPTLAFNPTVDLKGAEAVAAGQCEHSNRVYDCFLLKHNDKFYVVNYDKEGIVAIYIAKEFKENYKKGDVQLVWVRKNYI